MFGFKKKKTPPIPLDFIMSPPPAEKPEPPSEELELCDVELTGKRIVILSKDADALRAVTSGEFIDCETFYEPFFFGSIMRYPYGQWLPHRHVWGRNSKIAINPQHVVTIGQPFTKKVIVHGQVG